jgi:hypothetical protein
MLNRDLPVYMEFIEFITEGATSEDVARFCPSDEAQQRFSELLERNSEGSMTPEEAQELEAFMMYERLASLAKAKARAILANRS